MARVQREAGAEPVTNARCDATHPDKSEVRCVHTTLAQHRSHMGWDGDDRLVWRGQPSGPQTEDEWRAVAWICTDGLGVEIYYDPGDLCLRVEHDSIARWWDDQSAEYKREAVENYRASRAAKRSS